jgi:hypothetical protein
MGNLFSNKITSLKSKGLPFDFSGILNEVSEKTGKRRSLYNPNLKLDPNENISLIEVGVHMPFSNRQSQICERMKEDAIQYEMYLRGLTTSTVMKTIAILGAPGSGRRISQLILFS